MKRGRQFRNCSRPGC